MSAIGRTRGNQLRWLSPRSPESYWEARGIIQKQVVEEFGPSSYVESLVLFGIPVHNFTQKECVDAIIDRARAGIPAQVVTANLDFALQAWRDPEMHRILFDADMVVADGMPLVWFSKLFGPNLKERVAGSDLVEPLARNARRHELSLYALGAGPGVAVRAMEKLQQENPGLQVAGVDSPPCAPLTRMNHGEILSKIEDARPDILLVAYGAPKQEKWIRMHLNSWNVPVAIGVGATLDFLAGEHNRAPRFFQKIGLEWFWRMAREPKRLVRRYGADLLFLGKMLTKLAVLRLMPSEAVASWNPDPARVSRLGGALTSFKAIHTPKQAEAFLKVFEPVAQERPLVIDLSGRQWLNSLELGVLTQLAKSSRRSGLRLVLCSIPSRIRRLLNFFRLNHYIEMPASQAALDSTLDNLCHPAENGRPFVRLTEDRLTILLPSEFGRDQVSDLHQEVVRRWKSRSLQGIAIDASRTTFLDGPAAHMIADIGRMVVSAGGAVWLRGFRDNLLKFLRQEGLGSIGKTSPSPGWRSRRTARPRATTAV